MSQQVRARVRTTLSGQAPTSGRLMPWDRAEAEAKRLYDRSGYRATVEVIAADGQIITTWRAAQPAPTPAEV